jgi:hypothetical protein
MVPAALLGYDVAALCTAALTAELHRAAEFGRDLGNAVARGDHELTIPIDQRIPHFGLWAEQLIAESTGKDGTGCIPVPTKALDRNTDALTYSPNLENPDQLARAFYELEIAIAICGAVLGVDPFNEPNVAEAKTRTLDRLEGTSSAPIPLLGTGDVLSWLQASLTDATYLAVQAYVPLSKGEELHELQVVLEERFPDRAITTGFGPRYLHSTGQLHKGGPSSIVALQVVEEDHQIVPVPGRGLTFNEIYLAQADGDFDALCARGRTVARVNVTQLATLTLALRG